MSATQPLLEPYRMGELELANPDRDGAVNPFARNRS
jgi:hypothetical protein